MGAIVPLFRSLQYFRTLQQSEFACRRAARLGQSAKRAITALGALNYPVGDMPPRLVLLASECKGFASSLERDFHIS